MLRYEIVAEVLNDHFMLFDESIADHACLRERRRRPSTVELATQRSGGSVLVALLAALVIQEVNAGLILETEATHRAFT